MFYGKSEHFNMFILQAMFRESYVSTNNVLSKKTLFSGYNIKTLLSGIKHTYRKSFPENINLINIKHLIKHLSGKHNQKSNKTSKRFQMFILKPMFLVI